VVLAVAVALAAAPGVPPLPSVAAPCTERACFVTAAEKCTPVSGSLPIYDWTGMFTLEAQGRTDIAIQKAEGGACSVTLDVVMTDFRPKTAISRQKAIDRLNAAPRNHVRCLGTPAQITRLLSQLGTKAVALATLAVCKPTRCAPLPPLDEGCAAAACKDGEYALTCGKKTCATAGVDPDALAEGMVYGCGDAGDVRTRSRP